MINEYIRECKIGSGSYGKVVSVVFMVLNWLTTFSVSVKTIFLSLFPYMHDRLFIKALSMERIMQLR